jgi:hypothetical protein
MVRKSPDKQWNRQNSILFHETIPLKCLKNLIQCCEVHDKNRQKLKFSQNVMVILSSPDRTRFFESRTFVVTIVTIGKESSLFCAKNCRSWSAEVTQHNLFWCKLKG